MRKQYHFRPGDDGLDAWDVDRLVDLSRELPVRLVPLESIEEVDTAYWFGLQGDEPTVRAVVDHMRLAQAVDPAHPIILSHDGRVMDGMHRVARALLEGRSEIPAVRFDGPIEPDHRGCRPEDLDYG